MVYPSLSHRDAFYSGSSVNVLRGDNIRLQDARIEYRWINAYKKNSSFKTIDVYVYVNNINYILWRHSDSDLDPDFSFYSTSSRTLTMPTSTTITFGLNVDL
jgi:hypothetical protein